MSKLRVFDPLFRVAERATDKMYLSFEMAMSQVSSADVEGIETEGRQMISKFYTEMTPFMEIDGDWKQSVNNLGFLCHARAMYVYECKLQRFRQLRQFNAFTGKRVIEETVEEMLRDVTGNPMTDADGNIVMKKMTKTSPVIPTMFSYVKGKQQVQVDENGVSVTIVRLRVFEAHIDMAYELMLSVKELHRRGCRRQRNVGSGAGN